MFTDNYINTITNEMRQQQEIIDELIKMHAYEKRRGDLLQKDLDDIDDNVTVLDIINN